MARTPKTSQAATSTQHRAADKRADKSRSSGSSRSEPLLPGVAQGEKDDQNDEGSSDSSEYSSGFLTYTKDYSSMLKISKSASATARVERPFRQEERSSRQEEATSRSPNVSSEVSQPLPAVSRPLTGRARRGRPFNPEKSSSIRRSPSMPEPSTSRGIPSSSVAASRKGTGTARRGRPFLTEQRSSRQEAASPQQLPSPAVKSRSGTERARRGQPFVPQLSASRGRPAKPAPAAVTSANRRQPEASRGKPRYRPGQKALMEIRHYQVTTKLLIPALPFSRVCRELVQKACLDMGYGRDTITRFSRTALNCLHEAAETYLTQLFEDSLLLSYHAHRVTIMAKDMRLALRIRGHPSIY